MNLYNTTFLRSTDKENRFLNYSNNKSDVSTAESPIISPQRYDEYTNERKAFSEFQLQKITPDKLPENTT
jgi:hypothetical protein